MLLGPLYSLPENGIHYHYLCLPGPALMVLLCVVSLEACTPCTPGCALNPLSSPLNLLFRQCCHEAMLTLHGSFSLLSLVVPVSSDFVCLCQESRPEVKGEFSTLHIAFSCVGGPGNAG